MSLFKHLKRSRILNFNQVERDGWVKRQATLVDPGSRVLDLGAGGCPYRNWFSHCVYQSQDFVALKPEQLRDYSGYGKIDYVCDATAIPVQDGSFDVALCTEVLEHVPDPVKVVTEISRILKSGGKLLLTAPLGSGLHQLPYHFYGGYTPCWYQKFLTEAGFSDIHIEANGGFFKHYGQESIRFGKMLAPWNSRIPILSRALLLPVWVALLPWFTGILPVACHFLDNLDEERDLTIGYHVIAKKI
jgi:SAM-dependent methyltransferase